MPGPVVAGKLIDTACILWKPSDCEGGKTGNCQLYDNDHQRRIIHGTMIGIYVCATFFYLLAFTLAKGKCFGDEINEKSGDTDNNDLALTYKTNVNASTAETECLDDVSCKTFNTNI